MTMYRSIAADLIRRTAKAMRIAAGFMLAALILWLTPWHYATLVSCGLLAVGVGFFARAVYLIDCLFDEANYLAQVHAGDPEPIEDET